MVRYHWALLKWLASLCADELGVVGREALWLLCFAVSRFAVFAIVP